MRCAASQCLTVTKYQVACSRMKAQARLALQGSSENCDGKGPKEAIELFSKVLCTQTEQR